MRYCLVLLLLVMLIFKGYSQIKLEQESRIRADKVPTSAIDFVEALEPERKIKWYFEENLVGNSFEAKFKHRREKYSVEFDTSGSLQDIEIEVEFTTLPTERQQRIHSTLDSVFTVYFIRKTQLQYSGTEADLLQLVKEQNTPPEVLLRYELVIKGKQKEEINLYEFEFDHQGRPLTRKKIILKSSDHLEY